MTATQKFIEDAIEGGCPFSQLELNHWKETAQYLHPLDYQRLVSYALLNPLAWQAVGKTRGWCKDYEREWEDLARDFMVYLMRGKTIEEALSAIE